MSMRFVYSLLLTVTAAPAAFFGSTAMAAECRSLAGAALGGALITEATEIAAPATIATLSARRGVLVGTPMCRVVGVIRPVEDSLINFELWLPPADTWNGKYIGVGNGGLSGSIRHDELAFRFKNGYAVSSTDTGHIDAIHVSPESESDWMLGHPERVTDWAWRSHHLTAVASKQIIDAYYGTGPKFSYFIGCSKGGTSAMMEAQRFPADYDGIVAGAVGLNQTGQITGYLWTHQAVVAGWVSPAKLDLLRKAVLAACDARAGYLDDPRSCKFDPGTLLCKDQDSDACLTAAQVAAVRKIYSGPQDVNGKPLYAGFSRGSEYTWSDRIMGPQDQPSVGSTMWSSITGYLSNLVYGRRNLDFRALDPGDVLRTARQKYGSTIDALNTDLAPFKSRGGKMIQYIGWDDSSVRPMSSVDYYEGVAARMGGLPQVQSFYRLFMAPGMGHCGGGVAPSAVGQSSFAPAFRQDAEHDALAALEDWVERGRAPEHLIATRYRDNSPAKGVVAQRPWCPYPAVGRYQGQGDLMQASSYKCEIPKE
jgi:feruloyl esterase